eukprot:5774080-Alexandrium_andersonii.AAC.1
MSASLVGSEMCIRDRQPVCPSRRAQGALRWQPLIGRLCRVVDWGEPVSYTRLTLPTICSV